MGRVPAEDFVNQEPPTVTGTPAPDHEVLAPPGVLALDADARDPCRQIVSTDGRDGRVARRPLRVDVFTGRPVRKRPETSRVGSTIVHYEFTVDGAIQGEVFAERHAVEGDDLVFYDAVGGVEKSVDRRRVTELFILEAIPPIPEPEPWDGHSGGTRPPSDGVDFGACQRTLTNSYRAGWHRPTRGA